MVSEWRNKFSAVKRSGIIQLWYDTDTTDDRASIIKIAENDLE